MRFRYLPALAVLAAFLVPARALPCSPGICPVSLLAPSDGATNVPLNTRIWIGEQQYRDRENAFEETRLFEADSNIELALKRTEIRAESGYVFVFTPEHQLTPNTTYTINGVITFTTGTGIDTTPPSPPTVKQEEFLSDWKPPTSCGSSIYGAMYSLTTDGLLTVVDVGRATTIPAEFSDLQVLGIEATNVERGSATAFVGSGACRATPAKPGSETDVRFGTYDIAGNFSGFGDPLPVEIPSCGCASGSAPASALLLVLGVLSRRRSSTLASRMR